MHNAANEGGRGTAFWLHTLHTQYLCLFLSDGCLRKHANQKMFENNHKETLTLGLPGAFQRPIVLYDSACGKSPPHFC